MLLPKKTKYRKYQRGRRRGFSKGQTTVQAGDFGLKALEAGRSGSTSSPTSR
jgi:large subunit ribosomal protein L16